MFELYFKAIIQGIIEGLTEFLPVSSTGHLILANQWFGIEGDFGNLFAIVIQTGAILAVILYFKNRFLPKSLKQKDLKSYAFFWSKIVVAVIPAGVLGILFDDQLKEMFFNSTSVAIALIVGALLLLWIENRKHSSHIQSDLQVTYLSAFLIGIAQCMALFPGMSRSASTIIGGLLLGFNRSLAAEFSFFMAVPTLLGASLIELLKSGVHLTTEQWIATGIGTAVSFVVAYMVIAVFMNYIQKHNFKIFAWYRIALGIIVLLLVR